MNLHAFSQLSVESDSVLAAEEVARAVMGAFTDQPLKLVLAYATLNHEQDELLATLRASLPKDVMLVGCSVQGVISGENIREGGYLLGVMGLGGDELQVAPVMQRDFQMDTHSKGKNMGTAIKDQLGTDPNLVLLLWDSLCGADMEQLLSGLSEQLTCPVVGGGAGQPWGRMVRTVQYWENEVLSHSTIAIGLAGPFSVHVGVSHGTSPTGAEMTLTRSDGNRLIEIDGKPALQCWREVTGCTDDQINDQDFGANWAIGVQRKTTGDDGAEQSDCFVRAAFGFDVDSGSVIVQAAIPEGSRIVVHHRTVTEVVQGAQSMGKELNQRINGSRPWAVFGFECGARTSPFLGNAATLEENKALRKLVAPSSPWLGMMAWGEVAPVAGSPALHNYTYPLVVLCAS
jgi:hypothetical protein